ncbi:MULTISPECIES: SLC13 family permease [Pseudorhizobium]|uniref:Permease n=1 Tax=Pseudorhizobium pelagicum TaxID=1509405 RepID=A0A922P190_9HYPH|nr:MULTISPECIES: SLC13 family permease [Pseudorhizobium]MBU1316817.1 SLC13 family permease [Alphaproteobacteria bacterium]KEQ06246.1 permease [Pseudorhizobium pelagicum]KEQ09520.1 permease [Pseudorhizobium pelagicum]MBU1548264.1 SLC13 family permease [Alphaproteobacteria bacterium]MBU2335974.1 SLC13 family permease [Alphaproteobacteria bacterium]|tara:strand:- start:1549 stop:3321 length:1773 start_codon:yes stop_codon:yes gene_type:complete
MTTEQIFAFTIIGLMMVVFIWDRFRYDMVACCALIAAVAVGIVPFEEAFSGFSDDIVIIVGSALVVSAAVARSGIVDIAIKKFFPNLTSIRTQLALLMIVVAVLSAFIKNIGALAIMMPVAFQFSKRSGISPSKYLMPMAFSALLGGLMTQIGTSPNIVVSQLRADLTGTPFTMFDFTPVGAILTLVGITFLLFFHWLVPSRTRQNTSLEEAVEIANYTSEATVSAQSNVVGRPLGELLKRGDGEVIATAILRGATRMSPFPDLNLRENDTIILEGRSAAIDRVVSGAKLQLSGKPLKGRGQQLDDLISIEAIISRESPLSGLSARELALSYTRGVNLLAVSRRGQRLSERLRDLTLMAGDVIVLQGNRNALPGVMQDFALLPLAQREVMLGTKRKAFIPLVILAAAMISTALGWVPVAIAFFAAALGMAVFRAIPLTDLYKAVDGPILIMLAALIPVADTLRTSGASELIAGALGNMATGLPPWAALALILVTAMGVTPFLNNAATVLVMGPIAASFATALDYRPEAFLMAVAIGAGSDFLTPVGHQCNTLVMGPGGYKFSDYPRLGLPLSFIIVLVSVPTLLWVWPVG